MASNVLKWYWWRFNAYGYFWGMVSGIAAALVVPLALPQVSALNAFPLILVIALAGCLAGSLLTEPDEEEVLKRFYAQVRPWGFWKPIHHKVVRESPQFKKNEDFKRDVFNIVVGIIWQTALTALPIYLVIRKWSGALGALAVIAVTSIILKKTWYDRLKAMA